MYLDAYNLTRPMIDAAMGDCGHFKSHNVQARPHLPSVPPPLPFPRAAAVC